MQPRITARLLVVSDPMDKTHEDDKDKFSTISSEENYPPSNPSSKDSSKLDSDTDLFEVTTTSSVAGIKQNPRKKQKTTNSCCDQKTQGGTVGSFVTVTKIKTYKSVTSILVKETGNKFRIRYPNGEKTTILHKSESREFTLCFSKQEEEDSKVGYKVKTIKFDVIDLSDH